MHTLRFKILAVAAALGLECVGQFDRGGMHGGPLFFLCRAACDSADLFNGHVHGQAAVCELELRMIPVYPARNPYAGCYNPPSIFRSILRNDRINQRRFRLGCLLARRQ